MSVKFEPKCNGFHSRKYIWKWWPFCLRLSGFPISKATRLRCIYKFLRTIINICNSNWYNKVLRNNAILNDTCNTQHTFNMTCLCLFVAEKHEYIHPSYHFLYHFSLNVLLYVCFMYHYFVPCIYMYLYVYMYIYLSIYLLKVGD